MTTQTRTNTPDEPHEPVAVLEAVPTSTLDGQTGTGAIAIFYGAARYPFELARQRELVEDYADATGLNLVTEFHDRQQRQHGLGMLLDACQRGGVDYVITAAGPPPTSPPPKQARCSTSSQPAAPTWSASTPGAPATAPHQPGGTTKKAHGCDNSTHSERKSADSANRPANTASLAKPAKATRSESPASQRCQPGR